MDKERPIEKLLRRFGKKRRDEAGTPLEVHPATRRLLQGEVTRQYRKQSSDRSVSPETSVRWWPRLVYGLCVVALVAVMAAVLLPSSSGSKLRAARTASLSNLKQIDAAARQFAENNNDRLPASLDQLTNTLRAREVTVDPVTGRPFVYVAGGLSLKSLNSNSVLAYSPPSDGRNSVLLADGKVRQMTQDEFDKASSGGLIRYASSLGIGANEPSISPVSREELNRAKVADQGTPTPMKALPTSSTELARSDTPILPRGRETAAKADTRTAAAATVMAPASTPALAAPPQQKVGNGEVATGAAYFASKKAASTNTPEVGVGEFVNVAPSGFGIGAGNGGRQKVEYGQNQVANFKNSIQPVVRTPVLDAFTVEQNGSELLVIDSDGSTYAGNFGSQAGEEKEAAMDSVTQEAQARRNVATTAVNSVAGQNLAAQDNFFRVTGTNRTLKQQVVFTGNFVPVTNAAQAQQSANSGADRLNQLPSQQVMQLQFNNSMIVGKAQVDRNAEVEINAVPVLQKR